MATDEPHTWEFEYHRGQCFAAAYRMLGSVADTEDTVQETWLRWSEVDHGKVAHPKAYLVRTATRLALNKLRAERARRESYVGPWLPEPLTTRDESDAADSTLLAESAATGMLVILETLTPLERAVFVLHEVFEYSHADIAHTLQRTAASVRQIAHRARGHVRERQPRYDTDPATRRRVTARFLEACRGGDLPALLDVLAPGVTLTTDGGGKVRAALNPIHGASKVARFLHGIHDRAFREQPRLLSFNGEPGALLLHDGVLTAALTVHIADERVQQAFLLTNPDKLAAIPEYARAPRGKATPCPVSTSTR